MNRLTLVFSAALCVFFLCSSCASGKRFVRSDRVVEKRSSVRNRETGQRGKLSPSLQAQLRSRTTAWRWPLTDVQITSGFGERGSDYHDGIDLRASSGTVVFAAAPGNVIYSGAKIRGYGKMVVIKHENGLSSVYAHNSQLYVKKGDRVRRGQRISLSGNTGHSTGPHLHFEIRKGVTAINPASLLPSPSVIREVNRRLASESPSRVPARSSARKISKKQSSYRVRTSQSQSKPRRRTAKRYHQYSTRKSSVSARLASDDGFKAKKNRNY